MTTNQKETLLAELILEKNRAFSSGSPDLSIVQKISLRLNKLSIKDRSFFKSFVTEIKNDLFETGANIPGLNLSSFELSDEKDVPEIPIVDVEVVISNHNYMETLSDVLESLREELPTLKNYFFLRLISQNDNNYLPLLIYEEGCFYQPIRKKLQEKYSDCISKSITDIKDEIEKNTFSDSSFVAILIVSTKINEPEKVKERENNLKTIIDHYQEVYQLLPKKLHSIKFGDVIVTNNIESLLNEIKYVTSTFLTNAELTNDEEKIIKKLFQYSNCPILEYTLLKGGKSGSKVIEIRLKKNYASAQTKRYIVKFSSDGKGKISIEAERFGAHIEHYSIPGYQKTYEKNSIAEAIKYTYASSNSIVTSYSFSDIVKNPTNEFFPKKNEIIENIFHEEPFELWKQSTEVGKYKISDLYKEYIKPEKFFENVKIIMGIAESDLAKTPIFSYFNKIFNLEIDTKIKVCHGDFHSENFFYDINGIYLIDFGFTDIRHSIIDHTTLECSIKFKHVPFFIDYNILMDIEEQLLLDDSFNASFSIRTPRKDIIEYYDLIRLIRINSLLHLKDDNSKLEYLISLFIITCRHAQYNDLNQLYALKSAEIIGKRLVQLLS